ncbi:MAG: hypothetical protein IKI04_00420 [Bacilli bacterium]|nr:hypothetical protein [Bacilli bacterium]
MKKAKYKDVTKEWLMKATPNSHEILIDNYFIDDNGIMHPIKGKERMHSVPLYNEEYFKALWLKETFGGEIHLVPRITDISNTGISTPTPDYIWNNEKWDLKTPTTKGNFNNTLERFLKSKGIKKQATNFIIDYVNYKQKTDKEIIDTVYKVIYNRDWVNKIMVIRDKKAIIILIKK